MGTNILKSPKRKGSDFELKVAKLIRQSGLDKKAQRRPLSGSNKMVAGYADIISTLPFSFELKKQEKLKIWEWWEQAESEANMNRPPVLVFSSNFRPVMCALKFEDFLQILKELRDYRNKS